MSKVIANEFFVTVSMPDLMRWQDKNDDACEPAPPLQAAIREAGLAVDLNDLYFRFFDQIQVGHGDVYVYLSDKSSESLFVIDLYRDLTDQLDLISFGIRCDRQKAFIVAENLNTFFKEASIQISFERSSHCVKLHKLIDPRRYPSYIQKSDYSQKLITTMSESVV